MSGSGDAADADHHAHGHVGGVQVGKPHQEVDPRRNIAGNRVAVAVQVNVI